MFSDELIRIATKRRDIVAITAAMPGPTGLSAFGQRFPDRLFDVGIAEQHAMTSAAGLAMGGMHPVVAIYSTFLNRAFDQMMMDVAGTSCRSPWCWTGPVSPVPTAPATTACGTLGAEHRAGDAGRRPARRCAAARGTR